MRSYPFKKIDAFATTNSSGNPAGYIGPLKKQDISHEEMLQIAYELKGFVSEFGYLFLEENNVPELKYYSSEREVDFCGHATIATIYDLIKNNPDFQSLEKVTIKTNRGILDVENRLATENAVFVMAPEPVEKNVSLSRKAIADNLNIHENQIHPDFPVSIINAGLSTLIVPIFNLDSILKMEPDLLKLKEFCLKSGVDIVEVFTPDVFHKESHYRTRVFAATLGYLEDPATGSGNSAFGYYLIENGYWKSGRLKIEQNGLRERFNQVILQKKQDGKGQERVLFGGGAITRIEGVYTIYH
jgi:PhzF family phenazine biosynthesis protein